MSIPTCGGFPAAARRPPQSSRLRVDNDMRIRRFIALAVVLLLSVVLLGARRRPARSDPVCQPVSLSLTTSPRTVCASGGVVTLSWQASDPRATVVIDGMSGTYASSGSVAVTTGPRTFTGHASLACGAGPAATTTVTAATQPSGSLDGVSSIAQNDTGTLHVLAADTAQWSLSSSLGNPISPSVGTMSQDVSYSARNAGTDTVTLRLSSACGDQSLRNHLVTITPVSQGFLRCCDGTLSNSCTSCANKQGCCSHHGGVCGC
jgi:hypothetical protein